MNKILIYLTVGLLLLLIIQVKASGKTIDDQDSINTNSYNEKLPEKYKAVGGNIFIGKGILHGNNSEYITNPVFIGINVDILRQRMVIQIDDYIGFGKVKKTMNFPNDLEWSKNKAALHFMFGGNVGYALLNIKAFKFVPLTGIGADLLTSTFMGASVNSINEPFLPYYKVGCYMDIKSLKLFKNDFSFNDDESYTCVRLSVGLNSPIGKPKYDKFYSGNMIYFTIGMGGLSVQ